MQNVRSKVDAISGRNTRFPWEESEANGIEKAECVKRDSIVKDFDEAILQTGINNTKVYEILTACERILVELNKIV